jgi:BlaI family penicillinase repressor
LPPALSDLELQVMKLFWMHGALAVRQAQEKLAEEKPLAYTTIQTVIYRLEAKGALRRTRKIGNAHIFEAAISSNEIGRP